MNDLDLIVPSRLEYCIGGFFGPWFTVTLDNGMLLYGLNDSVPIVSPGHQTIPTEKQWVKFRQRLDSINVWVWEETYQANVLDGTEWTFEAVYADTYVKSYGCNNYPDKDGNPSNEIEESRTFRQLSSAIRLLIGPGCPKFG